MLVRFSFLLVVAEHIHCSRLFSRVGGVKGVKIKKCSHVPLFNGVGGDKNVNKLTSKLIPEDEKYHEENEIEK